MSSEGELKHFVYRNRGPLCKVIDSETCELDAVEALSVLHLIGEAKKDHPPRLKFNSKNSITEERITERLQEFWRWFEKWFGTSDTK